MELTATISNTIRDRGFRMTDQRREIILILARSGHLTPTEIREKLTSSGFATTEPTVYRTLDFLCAQGLATATHAGGRQLQYELARSKHHHLVCTHCRAHVDVPAESMRSMFEQIHSTTGFQILEEHLTLCGLCPACQTTGE